MIEKSQIRSLFYVTLSYVLIQVQGDVLPETESTTNLTRNDNSKINSSFQISEESSTSEVREKISTPSLRMITPCTTPNSLPGLCIPIKNCSILYDQLENEDARDFLQKSGCGPRNQNRKNPQVCCGEYSNFKDRVDEAVLPKQCGHQDVQVRARIYGGKEAMLGEFPWLARLIHKDGTKQFGCTGFLISSTFILTAGHCLVSENINNLGPIFEVQLGEHNTTSKKDCNTKRTICADKPQVIRVKKSIAHPGWDHNSANHCDDIGLIHLKKSANFTKYVSPICLSDISDDEALEYWVSGWGSTETEILSPIKLKVSMPPFKFAECANKYKTIGLELNERQVCAGGKRDKDSCSGDSGGPLMIVRDKIWSAVGVVSYGLGCGKAGWPGIYTKISSYTDWIQKTMLEQVRKKQKAQSRNAKVRAKKKSKSNARTGL